jgi:uncharacterized BrkB/YihY/UPF0761 family membrane protein
MGRVCIVFGWIILVLALLIGIIYVVVFNQFACVKGYEVEGLSAIWIALLRFLVACVIVTVFFMLGTWLIEKGKAMLSK